MKNFVSFSRLPFALETNVFLDAGGDVNTYLNPHQTYNQAGSSFSGKRFKKFLKKSPYLPFVVVFIVVIVIAVLVFKGISKTVPANSVLNANSSNQKAEIDPAKATQTLNREFAFPLRDESGKEVSKLKYEIQTVELRDQIIIKGEKATAVAGRTFLILNLKITNNYPKSIQLNVRDYVRLSVNGSDEKLAPDIHNDPVEVQAISTKYTRLGFPINDTDKNLVLQVGEVSGTKQMIRLELR